MTTYIATFFSHFGAIRFKRLCAENGWQAKLMPVPRTLSSSCGTCVRYQAPEDRFCPSVEMPEETEQVVEVLQNAYRECWRAEGS